jgi:hypothetical protein
MTRCDIRVDLLKGSAKETMLFDISFTCPTLNLIDSHIAQRVIDRFGRSVPESDLPLYHAGLREKDKNRKYKDKVAARGMTFIPHVTESNGALGAGTTRMLQLIQDGAAQRGHPNPSGLVLRFIEEQACLRIKAYAKQVDRVARACSGACSSLSRDMDDTLTDSRLASSFLRSDCHQIELTAVPGC